MGRRRDLKDRGYKRLLKELYKMSEKKPFSAALFIKNKRITASGFTRISDEGTVLGIEWVLGELFEIREELEGSKVLIMGPLSPFHKKMLKNFGVMEIEEVNG